MYYIVNKDNQVIATDNDLLSLLEINSLQELFAKTASGKLNFNELNKETIEIAIASRTVTLTQNRYPLTTLMGDLILVEVSEAKKAPSIETVLSTNTHKEEESLIKLVSKPEEVKEKGIFLHTEEKIKENFPADKEEESLIKLVSKPEEVKEKGIFLHTEEKIKENFPADKEEESLIKLVSKPEEVKEKGIFLHTEEKIKENFLADKEEESLIKLVPKPEELKEEESFIKLVSEPEEENEEESLIKLVSEPEEPKEEESFIKLVSEPEEPKEEEESFIKLVSEPEEEDEEASLIKLVSEPEEPKEEEESFIKLVSEPEEESEEESLIKLVSEPEEPKEEESFIKLVSEPEEAKEEEVDNTINLLPDEEIDFLKPTEKEIAEEEEDDDEEEDDTLLSFDENIPIDIDKISKMLGISEEDYSSFLDEFIDKAIEEEASIKDTGSAKHDNAISSLHNLSQMLHLTSFSGILEKAEKASGEKKQKAIELFYHNLSDLRAQPAEPEVITPEPETINYENQICELILDNVKLIHFDFQPKQASEELGLPVDLIEEFVHDFIDQANEEKQTFIDACREGDIDTIHKTGHKLKGAASNLRIGPLADTLEEIQFCEDDTRLEPLFKKYWGQFLGLEQTMNNISKQQGGK